MIDTEDKEQSDERQTVDGIHMCLRKNAGRDVRGSEGIGKTSMYTRLDEYDVFRNSAQRQTDDGKSAVRGMHGEIARQEQHMGR